MLLLLFVGAARAAAPTCYEYRASGSSGPWFPTATAAAQFYAGSQNVDYGNCQGTITSTVQSVSGGVGPQNFSVVIKNTHTPTGGSCNGWPYETTVSGSGAYRVAASCPPPEQCSKNPSHGVGQTFTSNHYPGADGYCNALSKCKMDVTSSTSLGGQTVYTITHTDQNCTHSQVPPPGEDDLSDGESCAGSGAVQFCSSEQGSANCGFVNGEYACLGSVEGDGCAVMPSGARACGASAPTPPVPDNGTPGQPADPDGQITINEGDTINYYNSSTVGGSNRPVNSGGDNPTDGHDDGNGAGRNEGDEEADGQDCEGSQCDFSGPELPEGDSFGAIGSAFIAEATATPIMGALTGISASVGTGECPTATFEVFGVEQTLDPMCDVWPSIAGVLSSVMLVIYGLGGVRILFSA